jgi:ABC-type nickel/cobalt efflux system permease component RcnA
MRKAGLILGWLVFACAAAAARGHDIPNARVDRAIQVTLRPGRLEVEYEVSLAELTLVRDLRGLIGAIPRLERAGLFARYGSETGPLNAKGLLVAINGLPIALRSETFELAVEEHPRYTFHYLADLPARGRLTLRDTNYVASEGTSRLALRATDGVSVSGFDGAENVADVPIRPVWQQTDLEEERSRQVAVEFDHGSAAARAQSPSGPRAVSTARSPHSAREASPGQPRLARLLDTSAGLWGFLLATAFALGAAHAIQPGHGKTLVAATAVGDRGRWTRAVALGLLTAATHLVSVVLIAGGLFLTRSARYDSLNGSLQRAAGLAIAGIGCWRLGRHLARWDDYESDLRPLTTGQSLFGLAIAGGIVPCWDAILLVTEAELLGRLGFGLALVAAFSMGLACVLVAIGACAAQFRDALIRRDPFGTWERRVGLGSALVLMAIGVYLLTT